MKKISQHNLNRLIAKEVYDQFGDSPPLEIASSVKSQVTNHLISQGFRIESQFQYDDVANMVAGGATLDDVKNELSGTTYDIPNKQIEEWFTKASGQTMEFDGPLDETTPIADDTPRTTEGRRMAVSTETNIRNAIAARIIEVLASSESATVGWVASRVKEDPVEVSKVASWCHRVGLVERGTNGLYSISQRTKDLTAELVLEDDLSLRAAAQIQVEAAPAGEGDNAGTNVDDAASVQDAIVTNENTKSKDTGTMVDPTDGVTTKIDDRDSVQDAVPFDSAGPANPAPDGTGTDSDAGTDAVDGADRYNDTVPFPSSQTGVAPEDQKKGSLKKVRDELGNEYVVPVIALRRIQ